MTITQQFLLVSIFPLAFVGLLILLRRRVDLAAPVPQRWALVLVAATVWASSLLRFYGGASLPAAVTHTWGVVGTYALTLASLGVLWTTGAFVTAVRSPSTLALGLGALLLVGAMGLDPAIAGRSEPSFTLADRLIRPFDLWAAVWMASWLLPLVAAILLTWQRRAALPLSMTRHKLTYWLLMLNLLIGGCLLASVQQPGQPAWQQLAMLLVLPAAALGTANITRQQLPDLQWTWRRLLRRLAGALVVFGLTWLLLWLVSERLDDLAVGASQGLLLVILAALAAALFIPLYRATNDVSRQLLRPLVVDRGDVWPELAHQVSPQAGPVALAVGFAQLVRRHLDVSDVWLFAAEDADDDALAWRLLAATGGAAPEEVTLAARSPFTSALRQRQEPIWQIDIDALDDFAMLTPAERMEIRGWQRTLFLPLHGVPAAAAASDDPPRPADVRLLAVLALGPRPPGEAVTPADLAWLRQLAAPFTLLLAHAAATADLSRRLEQLQRHSRTLAQQNHHLGAWARLQRQLSAQLTPALLQPWRRLQAAAPQPGSGAAPAEAPAAAPDQLAAVRYPLDRLVHVATQLAERPPFEMAPVHLDELVRRVERQLRVMAEARRVRVELVPAAPLPAILADEAQLTEAVHHLLHNAIKFNKIGGAVTLTAGATEDTVFLHVQDTGVGIPAERLARIWDVFGPPAGETGDEWQAERRPGLGLVLTRYIVDAHGGEVAVTSKYGAGSTFSLTLPQRPDE